MIKRFFITLVVVFIAIGTVSAQTVIQLKSTEIQQILTNNKAIIVLDVRTAEEFAAGHLKNAINIDIRKPGFYSEIDKLNKKKTYMVYCRTNHRSGMAVEYMKQKGFGTIYQMMDGFPGWAANNFTFEK